MFGAHFLYKTILLSQCLAANHSHRIIRSVMSTVKGIETLLYRVFDAKIILLHDIFEEANLDEEGSKGRLSQHR